MYMCMYMYIRMDGWTPRAGDTLDMHGRGLGDGGLLTMYALFRGLTGAGKTRRAWIGSAIGFLVCYDAMLRPGELNKLARRDIRIQYDQRGQPVRAFLVLVDS